MRTDRTIIFQDYNKIRSNIKLKEDLEIQFVNAYASDSKTYLTPLGDTFPFIDGELKYEDYINIFNEIRSKNLFNILFEDDSMIICQYLFNYKTGLIEKHRLLYLKSPEVVDYQIKSIRVDYDIDLSAYVEVKHPLSHLTFISSDNRTMINRKMTLGEFIYLTRVFIENKHFDNSEFLINSSFPNELSANEMKHMHITIPCN